MQVWIPIIVLAVTVMNTWVLKWVDLKSKTPETEKTKSRSRVYIRRYKTGIVILALLASTSTLAYLIFSSMPATKVTALLIAVTVCAIFMAVLSWILMVNNERIRQLVQAAQARAENAEFLGWMGL